MFPLLEDSKVPPKNMHWRKQSTRKTEVIKRRWKDTSNRPSQRNIGIDTGKSRLLVVDIDTKEGKEGLNSFNELNEEYGFPETLTARTPSGGLHLYYRAYDDYRNTTEKVAPGIDTRAVGGYVVAPGSDIDDVFYEWDNEEPIADAPEWLTDMLRQFRVKEVKDKDAISTDDEADIERAREWLLNSADPAVEGRGGDNHTFTVAAHVKDFGVSAETAFNLMAEHWNDQCSPPWDLEDLWKKVVNAYKHSQNATGVLSEKAEFEAIDYEDDEEVTSAPPFLTPLEVFDLSAIPPREWIFDHLAIAKKVSILIAPPGAGKSSFTLGVAMAKATGRHDIMEMDTIAQEPVAVYNNEDDMEEMHRRLAALMQHHNVDFEDMRDEFGSMLYLNSGEFRPLRIAKKVGPNGKIKAEDTKRLIRALKKNGIRLLIIDPFAETHPANENSNEELLEVGRLYRQVAQEADCAVLLVHHTRKLDTASSDGHEGNLESLRGASSLAGIARIVATFLTMSKAKAKEYGISEEDRHRYVGLSYAKSNLSAVTTHTYWFERIGERIGVQPNDPDSGEEIGLVKPVKLKKKEDMMTDNVRTLLYDIEAMVEGESEGKTVADIAKELSENYPMHIGKNPQSLQKAIRRLFDGEKPCLGQRGELKCEQEKHGKRTTLKIRWHDLLS